MTSLCSTTIDSSTGSGAPATTPTTSATNNNNNVATPVKTLSCSLCPNNRTPLKQLVNKNGNVHLICALYLPNVQFRDSKSNDMVDISSIPADNYTHNCCLCIASGREAQSRQGACIPCYSQKCDQWFHVTCAQSQGTLYQINSPNNGAQNIGLCPRHVNESRNIPNCRVIPIPLTQEKENACNDSSVKTSTDEDVVKAQELDKTAKLSPISEPSDDGKKPMDDVGIKPELALTNGNSLFRAFPPVTSKNPITVPVIIDQVIKKTLSSNREHDKPLPEGFDGNAMNFSPFTSATAAIYSNATTQHVTEPNGIAVATLAAECQKAGFDSLANSAAYNAMLSQWQKVSQSQQLQALNTTFAPTTSPYTNISSPSDTTSDKPNTAPESTTKEKKPRKPRKPRAKKDEENLNGETQEPVKKQRKRKLKPPPPTDTSEAMPVADSSKPSDSAVITPPAAKRGRKSKSESGEKTPAKRGRKKQIASADEPDSPSKKSKTQPAASKSNKNVFHSDSVRQTEQELINFVTDMRNKETQSQAGTSSSSSILNSSNEPKDVGVKKPRKPRARKPKDPAAAAEGGEKAKRGRKRKTPVVASSTSQAAFFPVSDDILSSSLQGNTLKNNAMTRRLVEETFGKEDWFIKRNEADATRSVPDSSKSSCSSAGVPTVAAPSAASDDALDGTNYFMPKYTMPRSVDELMEQMQGLSSMFTESVGKKFNVLELLKGLERLKRENDQLRLEIAHLRVKKEEINSNVDVLHNTVPETFVSETPTRKTPAKTPAVRKPRAPKDPNKPVRSRKKAPVAEIPQSSSASDTQQLVVPVESNIVPASEVASTIAVSSAEKPEKKKRVSKKQLDAIAKAQGVPLGEGSSLVLPTPPAVANPTVKEKKPRKPRAPRKPKIEPSDQPTMPAVSKQNGVLTENEGLFARLSDHTKIVSSSASRTDSTKAESSQSDNLLNQLQPANLLASLAHQQQQQQQNPFIFSQASHQQSATPQPTRLNLHTPSTTPLTATPAATPSLITPVSNVSNQLNVAQQLIASQANHTQANQQQAVQFASQNLNPFLMNPMLQSNIASLLSSYGNAALLQGLPTSAASMSLAQQLGLCATQPSSANSGLVFSAANFPNISPSPILGVGNFQNTAAALQAAMSNQFHMVNTPAAHLNFGQSVADSQNAIQQISPA